MIDKITCALLFAALTSAAGVASATTTKAEFNATKDKSSADYQRATEQCKSLAGNPKDVCTAEAKAARKKSDAMAEADYKATPKARSEAAATIADADYDVAQEKCNARNGNEKDVCVKEAKAAQVKAKADAKAMEKTTVARQDATDDKRDADYKVAMEKCDGFAGDAKSSCQKNAKATYGK